MCAKVGVHGFLKFYDGLWSHQTSQFPYELAYQAGLWALDSWWLQRPSHDFKFIFSLSLPAS